MPAVLLQAASAPSMAARHIPPHPPTHPASFLLDLTCLHPKQAVCSWHQVLLAGFAPHAPPHPSLHSFALPCTSEPFPLACISTLFISRPVHHCRAPPCEALPPNLDALPCGTGLWVDALPAFARPTMPYCPHTSQTDAKLRQQPAERFPAANRTLRSGCKCTVPPSRHLSSDLPPSLPFTIWHKVPSPHRLGNPANSSTRLNKSVSLPPASCPDAMTSVAASCFPCPALALLVRQFPSFIAVCATVQLSMHLRAGGCAER